MKQESPAFRHGECQDDGISYEYTEDGKSRVFTSTPHNIALLDFENKTLTLLNLEAEYNTAIKWLTENTERDEEKLRDLLGEIQAMEKGKGSRIHMLATLKDEFWSVPTLDWMFLVARSFLTKKTYRALVSMCETEIERMKNSAASLAKTIERKKNISFESAYSLVRKYQSLVVERFSPLGFTVSQLFYDEE